MKLLDLNREDWILSLLFAGGRRRKYNEPIAGRTRLMKEIFLLWKRVGEPSELFDFYGYKFGPHSDEVLQTLEGLVRSGFVESTPGYGSEAYSLTPRGVERTRGIFRSLDEASRRLLVDVKIQFNTMRLHDLLDYVYDRFPDYTDESEYEGPQLD